MPSIGFSFPTLKVRAMLSYVNKMQVYMRVMGKNWAGFKLPIAKAGIPTAKRARMNMTGTCRTKMAARKALI
jgi:hypothetical protein